MEVDLVLGAVPSADSPMKQEVKMKMMMMMMMMMVRSSLESHCTPRCGGIGQGRLPLCRPIRGIRGSRKHCSSA